MPESHGESDLRALLVRVAFPADRITEDAEYFWVDGVIMLEKASLRGRAPSRPGFKDQWMWSSRVTNTIRVTVNLAQLGTTSGLKAFAMR